jgi:hypothetical protein
MSAAVLARKGASPIWPGVIAIARRLDLLDTVGSPHPKAGNWLTALKHLADRITSELGVEMVLMDLGTVETEVAKGVCPTHRTPGSPGPLTSTSNTIPMSSSPTSSRSSNVS